MSKPTSTHVIPAWEGCFYHAVWPDCDAVKPPLPKDYTPNPSDFEATPIIAWDLTFTQESWNDARTGEKYRSERMTPISVWGTISEGASEMGWDDGHFDIIEIGGRFASAQGLDNSRWHNSITDAAYAVLFHAGVLPAHARKEPAATEQPPKSGQLDL